MQRPAGAQSTVEFALVVGLFLLLMVGVVDVARAYLAYTVVTNATREAARYGASHLGAAGWEAAARDTALGLAAPAGVDRSSVALSVAQVDVGGLPHVSVTASYPFHPITPLVGSIFGNPIMIRAEVRTQAG